MFNKFLIVALGTTLFSTALASDQIVTLKKNDPAPFSGTLFSTSAAARIAIELENSQATCNLKIGEAVEKQKAYDKFQLDLKQASIDACFEKYTVVTELKQNQIDYMSEQLKKNTGPQPAWWFAGGVVGGITVTVLSAWALSQASN
tara:strand:+ start:316 stop:753 length:438 start_codon:yes stop_codon:yes gene_type:complete